LKLSTIQVFSLEISWTETPRPPTSLAYLVASGSVNVVSTPTLLLPSAFSPLYDRERTLTD